MKKISNRFIAREVIMKKTQRPSYPLRLEEATRAKADDVAKQNRRSLNVELGLLIEEGLKWREMQSEQARA